MKNFGSNLTLEEIKALEEAELLNAKKKADEEEDDDDDDDEEDDDDDEDDEDEEEEKPKKGKKVEKKEEKKAPKKEEKKAKKEEKKAPKKEEKKAKKGKKNSKASTETTSDIMKKNLQAYAEKTLNIKMSLEDIRKLFNKFADELVEIAKKGKTLTIKGDKHPVSIYFKSVKEAAKEGRNPKTEETISIPEKISLRMKSINISKVLDPDWHTEVVGGKDKKKKKK